MEKSPPSRSFLPDEIKKFMDKVYEERDRMSRITPLSDEAIRYVSMPPKRPSCQLGALEATSSTMRRATAFGGLLVTTIGLAAFSRADLPAEA